MKKCNFEDWKSSVLRKDEAKPLEDSFKATGLIVKKGDFEECELLAALYTLATVWNEEVYSVAPFKDTYAVYMWGRADQFYARTISEVLSTTIVAAYDGEESLCAIHAYDNGDEVNVSEVECVRLTVCDDGESEPGYRDISVTVSATDGNELVVGGGMVPFDNCKDYLPEDEEELVIKAFASEKDMLRLAVDFMTCNLEVANSMCELSHSVLAEKSLKSNPSIGIVQPRKLFGSLNEKEREYFCELLCEAINEQDECVGEIVGFDYEYDEFDILLTYNIDSRPIAEKARRMAVEGGDRNV